MIIVEGPRNVGKSFLIKAARRKSVFTLKEYKFPFLDYSSILEEKDLKGLSLGKDLALLELNKTDVLNPYCIVDRGIFSTLTYGLIFKRLTEREVCNILDYIDIKGLLDFVNIVYIDKNVNLLDSRDKDEEKYSSLSYEQQNRIFLNILNKRDIKFHKFTNNFNENSENDFNKLIKDLINEHK